MSAIHHCVESPRVTCDYVDIGAGKAFTVMDLIKALAEALGVNNPTIIFCMRHCADVDATLSDNSALGELTGFRPRIAFAEGIRKYVEWLRGQ